MSRALGTAACLESSGPWAYGMTKPCWVLMIPLSAHHLILQTCHSASLLFTRRAGDYIAEALGVNKDKPSRGTVALREALKAMTENRPDDANG